MSYAQRHLVGGSATLTAGCITIQKQVFVKYFHSLPLRQGRRDLFLARQAIVRASGRATGAVVPWPMLVWVRKYGTIPDVAPGAACDVSGRHRVCRLRHEREGERGEYA
jgi:hypothetical protein